MTRTLQRQRDGQPVALTGQLASSGEGTVWTTSAPGLLAKIYHQPTPERLAKLEAMLADPPVDPMAGRQHVTFAWPTDLLRDLFLRAFNDGQVRPNARPAAAEWVDILQRANEDLAACPRCPTHFFSTTYGRCCWCERRQQVGVDVFEPLATRRGPVPRQVACAVCGRQNQVAASNPGNAFCASCRSPLGASPGHQPAPSLFAQLGQSAAFVASLGQRLVQMVQGINSALSGGPPPAPVAQASVPAPPRIRRRRKPRPTRVAAGIVVGNNKSKRYHGPSCGTGAKIGYKRRVQFGDWRDAERAGYKRCGACQGR